MTKTNLIITFLLINLTVIAQKHNVDISNTQTETGYILSAKNNTDVQQELSLTLNVKNLKGYKKPIVKLIPANTTVEIITLRFIKGKKGSFTTQGRTKPKPTSQEIALQRSKLEAKAIKDISDIKEGIVVFSKDGCTRCHYVTSYMLDNDIDFKFLNTTENEDYNKLMWQLLRENDPAGANLKRILMPVVLVNGEVSHTMKDLKAFVSKFKK